MTNAEYHREWYQKNKAKRMAANARWRRGRQSKMHEQKVARGCDRCGYNNCAKALEWHHTDPSVKDATIADIIRRGRSDATLSAELEKVILLCANCHRELHTGLCQG